MIKKESSTDMVEKKWGCGNCCPGCQKNVYPQEQVFAADRKPWHKGCIKCAVMGCRYSVGKYLAKLENSNKYGTYFNVTVIMPM